MLKDGNFVRLEAFMINDLELGYPKLTVYAIVYGFCQDNNSCYIGGPSYVACWLGVSERQARRLLRELEDDNLIKSKPIFKKGHWHKSYYCTPLN